MSATDTAVTAYLLEAMQQRYRELTGFDADSASDIGIRLRVLAEQTAGLYEHIEELGRQAFAQTSTGKYLDLHAECRGISRKAALHAMGTLRFSRESAPAAGVPIAAGTVCTTGPDPQLGFVTTADAVLPAGGVAVDVAARAVDAGAAGNVAAHTVTAMVSSPAGITAVTNPARFEGGLDAEDDESLRTRLLDAYRSIPNGTNAAYYRDIAMGYENVVSAAVLPRARGRGTVDVAISCAQSGQDDAAARGLQTLFEGRREVNVDVRVYPAPRRYVPLEIAVATAKDYDHTSVARACMQEMSAFMGLLGVGEPLLTAHLLRHLLGVPGVYNARVLSPTADVEAAPDEILRAGDSSVGRLAGA